MRSYRRNQKAGSRRVSKSMRKLARKSVRKSSRKSLRKSLRKKRNSIIEQIGGFVRDLSVGQAFRTGSN